MHSPLGLRMWILKCISPILTSLSQVRGTIFSLRVGRNEGHKECAVSAAEMTELSSVGYPMMEGPSSF